VAACRTPCGRALDDPMRGTIDSMKRRELTSSAWAQHVRYGAGARRRNACLSIPSRRIRASSSSVRRLGACLCEVSTQRLNTTAVQAVLRIHQDDQSVLRIVKWIVVQSDPHPGSRDSFQVGQDLPRSCMLEVSRDVWWEQALDVLERVRIRS
jgi:hypothetical protein